MKKYLSYLTALILFFSCVSVEFTSPQPSWEEDLGSFPTEMHGTYYSNENDTFEIGTNYYKIVSTSDETFFKTNENQVLLSDSMTLKKYGNSYFLNVKEKGNWTVSSLKVNRNNTISIGYIIGPSEDLVKKLDFINDKAFVKDEDGKVDRIILNPTKKEFKLMVRKKLFEQSLLLTKISK